jgi:C4-dicarboxylate transporter DctQ subunit
MKLGKLINSGIPILCGVLLLSIVSCVIMQVIARVFFNFSFNWSNEMSQFCMTWLALFGSIWLDKNNRQISTGLKWHKNLNPWLVCLIDGILALVIFIFAAILVYQSAIYVWATMDTSSLSLSWLKMGYVFIAVPLAMLAACYYYLKNFFENVTRVFKKD